MGSSLVQQVVKQSRSLKAVAVSLANQLSYKSYLMTTQFQPYMVWVMAFTGFNIIDGIMPWLLMVTGMLPD